MKHDDTVYSGVASAVWIGFYRGGL